MHSDYFEALGEELLGLSEQIDRMVEEALRRLELNRRQTGGHCSLLVANEHARALTHAAAIDSVFTASVLLRPIREALIKHNWFLHVATREEIAEFAKGQFQVSNRKVLDALRAEHPDVVELLSQDQGFRSIMDGYVHTGHDMINQAVTYFTKSPSAQFRELHRYTLLIVGANQIHSVCILYARMIDQVETTELLSQVSKKLLEIISTAASHMGVEVQIEDT